MGRLKISGSSGATAEFLLAAPPGTSQQLSKLGRYQTKNIGRQQTFETKVWNAPSVDLTGHRLTFVHNTYERVPRNDNALSHPVSS